MITQTAWDILVVGAGPAGSRAAAVASSKGGAVLLIDAKSRIGEQPHCGECVQTSVFDEFNLDRSSWIQPVERMDTFVLDWDVPQDGSSVSDFGQAPKIEKTAEAPMEGVSIDRVRFDRDLARSAASCGATVMSSSRFVKRENDTWIVRCGADEVPLRPRIVVAADGARSRVAAEMGMEPPELATGLQVEVPMPAPIRAMSIFLSRAFYGGYGWLIPKGNAANVGIGIIPRPKTNLRRLLHVFVELLSGLGMIGPGRLATYAGMIPGSGMRATLTQDNVVLCGDAGGFTDPLTGAGIAQAVASGSQAGEAAAAAVKTGTHLALRNYQKSMAASYGQSQQEALSIRRRMISSWDDPDFERTCRETWLSSILRLDSSSTISSYLRGGK